MPATTTPITTACPMPKSPTPLCPFRLIRDSDGDGSLDGYEAVHSSDPCSAASKPLPRLLR